jgi:hypothetical protein
MRAGIASAIDFNRIQKFNAKTQRKEGAIFPIKLKFVDGMKRRTLGIVLSSLLLTGCNQSTRKLVGGYSLERFDEGGTSYYLEAPGYELDGGGVLDGTIQEIGWNQDWILARVNRLYGGDTNGWYALNLKTKQISGPLREFDLKTNSALSGIKCRVAVDVFTGKR